jgi:hypothetical protein
MINITDISETSGCFFIRGDGIKTGCHYSQFYKKPISLQEAKQKFFNFYNKFEEIKT